MDASRDAGYLGRVGERKRFPEQFDRILTEFESTNGKVLVGRLWDLSREGACMQVLGQTKVEENMIGTLKFRHVDTFKELDIVAEVCWLDNKDRYSLIGLVFASKLPESGHLLDAYL